MAAGRIEPYATGDDADGADGAAGDEDGDGADGTGVPDDDSAEAARWDAMMAAEDDEPPAIAFVGRPNVGKSSLLNALLGETRTIVSDIPGTTRDAIDTTIPWGRSEVVLIDTAGIRKRGKVASGPAAERYSTLRALKAISRADVAVLVLDAADGLTAQDAHVAGYVVEEGRGLVIAVNKWDIVEDKTHKSFDEFAANLRRELPFIDYAPVVSISAKTGQRVAEGARAGGRGVGRAAATDPDGRAQPPRLGRGGAHAAGAGPRASLEDPVRDPGRRRAADVRVLRHRPGVDPLLVSPLSREPAARRVRVRRHADPARVPRPDPRQAARDTGRRARGRADGRRRGPEGDGGRGPGAGRGRRRGRLGHDAGRDPRAAGAGRAAVPLPGDGGTDPRRTAQRGAAAGDRPARAACARRTIRRRSPRRRTWSCSRSRRPTSARPSSAPRRTSRPAPTCCRSSRASSAGPTCG